MTAVMVNPGRYLRLDASLELGTSQADADAIRRQGAFVDPVVFDRDTGERLELADLLRRFLADPTETITGPIRITIEPAS